jgi:hypothetical protein
VTGHLVGVTPSAVTVRTAREDRVFAASEVTSIRSKTSAKLGAGIGALVGLAAGVGIYAAADKDCNAAIQEPFGCAFVNIEALWVLMSAGTAVGLATGLAVGHALPGPLLFEPSEPSPRESHARRIPSIAVTPCADGRGVALHAVVRFR